MSIKISRSSYQIIYQLYDIKCLKGNSKWLNACKYNWVYHTWKCKNVNSKQACFSWRDTCLSRLTWIFPRDPLKVDDGIPENIQGPWQHKGLIAFHFFFKSSNVYHKSWIVICIYIYICYTYATITLDHSGVMFPNMNPEVCRNVSDNPDTRHMSVLVWPELIFFPGYCFYCAKKNIP